MLGASEFRANPNQRIIGLILIGAFAFTLTPVSNSNTRGIDQGGNQLRLTTSIVKERYCSDDGTLFLEWSLNLNYINDGPEPILLDKRSTRVFRTKISTSVKAAAAKRYVYDPYPVYASYDTLGFRPTPDPNSFAVLKPMESLTIEAKDRVGLYDGTKDTKDDLHPGKYLLQVTISTWRYYADAKEYRAKWSDKGYLWSEGVMSEPMPFTVEKRPKVTPCSK